jgi:hypothetical protein
MTALPNLDLRRAVNGAIGKAETTVIPAARPLHE